MQELQCYAGNDKISLTKVNLSWKHTKIIAAGREIGYTVNRDGEKKRLQSQNSLQRHGNTRCTFFGVVEEMKIDNPDVYFGKKIKVYSEDIITVGKLYGYDYDFDDDGNEYLELDVENENGLLIGFTEDEIDKIEIIKKC